MSDQIETRLVDVAFPFFSGKAGLRVKDGITELAYQGIAPRRLPVAVTLEGEACSVIAARPSTITRGMIVLFIDRG